MNYTKDFQDYIGIVKNTFVNKFHFKCEKYNPIDKCTIILRQMIEVENNIDSLKTVSKKSSPFNDTHLKLGNISSSIKNTLNDIEKGIKSIERNLKEIKTSDYERKTLYNTLELLNNHLKNVTLKFNKFLQSQSEIIKTVEKRRSNLSGVINQKKNKNEYVYTKLPTNDQDEILDLENQQTTMQTNSNRTAYFQERSNAVQYVERMMNDLSSMFSRISQIAYEQRSMIEKIDNNTDISLNNIESGLGEVIKMQKDVRSSRSLILKIFFILVFTSILYIVFFA